MSKSSSVLSSIMFMILVSFGSSPSCNSNDSSASEKSNSVTHPSSPDPEAKLDESIQKRIANKARELDKQGIVGAERRQKMEAEWVIVNAEMNKVRASNYTVPFSPK